MTSSPARQRAGAPGRGSFWAPLIGLVVLLLIIGGLGFAGWSWLKARMNVPPIKIEANQQCVATAGDTTSSLTLEQTKYAGIIAAEGMRRGLSPRAVTIALATAMQESSLRNLDHGDRDSVGLFQQRPSQDWGTVEQIMDPWYSSGRFYVALVKVPGWETGDINDMAQKVQRSGHPDAYRKHVPMARAWASVLTGHSPAGISCVRHDGDRGSTSMQDKVLKNALGSKAKVTRSATALVITSSQPTTLWSAVALAMSQYQQVRAVKVEAAGQQWLHDDYSVAPWTSASPDPSATPTRGAPVASATTAVLTIG